MRSRIHVLPLILAHVLWVGGPAAAERLAWTSYTTSHGLAGDAVRGLYQDSLGFLWIATSSGLSRFDGQVFRNYDSSDGLPGPRIAAIAETVDGSIWLGSPMGLARGRPDAAVPGRPFEPVTLPPPLDGSGVDALAADLGEAIYVGNVKGLARLSFGSGEVVAEVVDLGDDNDVTGLAMGPDGTLWIATTTALLRRRSDDGLQRFTVDPSRPAVGAVTLDHDGRLWLVIDTSLLVWWPQASPDGAAPDDARPALVDGSRWPARAGDLPRTPGEAVLYDMEHFLPNRYPTVVAVGREAIWVATRGGVMRFEGGGMTVIDVEQGLNEPLQYAALEDATGALWLGSDSRGLARLGRSGFVGFDTADGLAGDRVSSIFEDGEDLYVVTWFRDLHRWTGRRFEDVTPAALRDIPAGWGWNQIVVRDRRGATWYPTGNGLYRFPPGDPGALAAARPERHWSTADGLPSNDVFRLYEDRQGVVWVSMIGTPPLVAVDGDRVLAVPEVAGEETGGAPTAFAEDRAGDLWMGFYLGGLARHRSGTQDGAWRFFGAADGLPLGFVGDLHLDPRGRLWMATTTGGVAVIDDPTADTLSVRRYTTENGLTTDSAFCLAEDPAGRMFIGGAHGVDRLDSETGSVVTYSSGDGLPNTVIWTCYAAADGSLWFGTLHGLARFVPPPEDPAVRPAVRLGGLTVAGRPIPVADRGVEQLEGLVMKPGQSSLQVSYVGVGLGLGQNLRFQHRVIGGDAEWSPPSAERTVQFAALAPGEYRFEVRATTRDGLASPAATLSFRVLPRFWQRPWFPVAVALVLAGIGVFLSRLRTARLVAVERARTRIASDLHDDVGSSVSRIGLLNEIVRRRLDASAETEEMLDEIAREVGELAEATSDIVWAVDPRRDDLGSLLVRLRRFAADLLEAKDIALDFSAPANAERVRLSPEVRRALYLILKEAIHNVAKHSGARRAAVTLELADGAVRGEVRDDGRGIAPGRAAQAEAEGRHGLPGLVRRAAEAGGEARVESPEGGGTRVILRFRTG